MLTERQEELKNEILFHNDMALKLERIFQGLRAMAGSPGDPVWKYAQMVAIDRDLHQEKYRAGLEEIFDSLKIQMSE
jgi:hypothetical protein